MYINFNEIFNNMHTLVSRVINQFQCSALSSSRNRCQGQIGY